MRKKSTQLKFVIALAVMLLAPWNIEAAMSSANYTIPSDDLSAGGGLSTSTNYKLTDTVSEQTTPTGENFASANYKACAGFECLQAFSFITASIATSASPCTATTSATPPFSVPLGTLATGSVATGANHVCVISSAGGASSIAVTIKDSGSGLKSTSVPSDVISSVSTTLAAGTAGFGVCSSNAANGFTASAPFNGSCTSSGGNAVGGPTTTTQTIYTSAGTITNAFGDILVKTAISGATAAHFDYADTLTLVITATF